MNIQADSGLTCGPGESLPESGRYPKDTAFWTAHTVPGMSLPKINRASERAPSCGCRTRFFTRNQQTPKGHRILDCALVPCYTLLEISRKSIVFYMVVRAYYSFQWLVCGETITEKDVGRTLVNTRPLEALCTQRFRHVLLKRGMPRL